MSEAVSASAYRTRIFRRGLSTSLIQRAVGAIVPLISVPLALHHLGREDYGAWATAVALTALLAYADLGIGIGLMTRLGSGVQSGRLPAEARRLISSAYLLVFAVVAVLLIALSVFAALGGMGVVLRGGPGSHVGLILYLTVAAFLTNILVSLIVQVQYAVGQQASSNMWQTAGTFVMLGSMLVASRASSDPAWFVIATVFSPVAVGGLNSLFFYGRNEVGRQLVPSLRQARLQDGMSLLGLGSKFLLISILLAAGVALDPWIVAHTAALGAVANYSVPQRVFSVAGLLSVSALMPLWPLQAQAVADGDTAWVTRTTRKVTIATVSAMAALTILLVVTAPWLVHLWLGGAIQVDRWMWCGLGLMCVVQALVGPMFMVQNGAEVLAPQIVGYLAFLIAVPLKIELARRYGYGLIPWVTVGCYCALIVPAAFLGYRKAVRKAVRRAGMRAMV